MEIMTYDEKALAVAAKAFKEYLFSRPLLLDEARICNPRGISETAFNAGYKAAYAHESDQREEAGMVEDAVAALVEKYSEQWRDKDDHYWLARLIQEVGELGSSLVGDHEDTPEHELKQIASIAINWLNKRAIQAAQGGKGGGG